MLFETTNPNKSYKTVLKYLVENGNKVSPRGLETLELQPAIHVLTEPHKKLCSVPGRKANPFFNMAENMWILSGRASAEWICTFNNKLFEYQGDEGFDDFNAAYGRRIRHVNKHRDRKIRLHPYFETSVEGLPQVDQMLHCYETLRKDKHTRHAVISLWNPILDNFNVSTKDRPCNCLVMFKIRDEKLNMTVCNRSNDIHLGLYGVNFVQFSHIQEFLAASLDIPVGHYVHLSDSLHVYSDSKHTSAILESSYDFDVYDYVKPITLSYKDVEDVLGRQSSTIGIGDFLSIADQVMSESVRFRSTGCSRDYVTVYCATKYAKACAMYLMAYDMQKQNRYEDSLYFLSRVSELGFYDWAVLGIEFILRKKSSEIFSDKFDKLLSEVVDNKAVVAYAHGH